MKYSVIIIIVLVCHVSICHAQYPLRNYMFEQNKFTINPAYGGEIGTRLSLTSLAIPKSLEEDSDYFIQGINFDFTLPNLDNVATGTRLLYVNQEIFTEFVIDQSLVYKLDLNKDQLVSFGLSIGLNRITTNLRGGNGGNIYVDQSDPLLKSEIESENNLRMEAGSLYKNGNFEFSLSLPYLFDSKGIHFGLNTYFGYTFNNYDDFQFKPSFLLLKTSENHYSLTGSINVIYIEKFWVQFNVTDFNQAVIGLGAKFNNIGIGYNFSKPLTINLPSSAMAHQFGFFVNFL